MSLTKKETAELKRLDRKILGGKKVSRKEIMRGFELKRKKAWINPMTQDRIPTVIRR